MKDGERFLPSCIKVMHGTRHQSCVHIVYAISVLLCTKQVCSCVCNNFALVWPIQGRNTIHMQSGASGKADGRRTLGMQSRIPECTDLNVQSLSAQSSVRYLLGPKERSPSDSTHHFFSATRKHCLGVSVTK